MVSILLRRRRPTCCTHSLRSTTRSSCSHAVTLARPQLPAIEEQIRAIDKNTLVFNPAFMTEVLSHSLAQRRFTMSLLAAFGALALLLAAVGVYGLMSMESFERVLACLRAWLFRWLSLVF